MKKLKQTLKWVPIVICLLISIAFALMPKASSAGMQTIPECTQIALITRVVDGEIFQFNDCKHFNELLLLKGFDLVTTFLPNAEHENHLSSAQRHAREAQEDLRNKEKLSEVKLQTKEIIVYITKTGSKYHRAGCKHLKKSSIPITLEEAKERGYTPCKVCNPPT